jgi:hypothetical protein
VILDNVFGKTFPFIDPASFFGKLQSIIDAPAAGPVVNDLAKEIGAARFVTLFPKEDRTSANNPF